MRRRCHTPLLTAIIALVGAPAAHAAAPSVSPRDTDTDGRIDAVALGFQGALKGKPSASAFSVAGYRVTRVTVRGRSVLLSVSEQQSCDLGLRPVVRYRPGRSALKVRGRAVRRFGLDGVARDRRAPRMTCAETADRDGDGKVDSVTITYSKPITARRQAKGPYAFGVDGFRVTGVAASRSRWLRLSVAERGSRDGGVVPAVTYRRPTTRKMRGAVISGRGGRSPSVTWNATRDGVAPLLEAASTADTDRDGLVDHVHVRYAERVRARDRGVSVSGAPVRSVSADGLTVTATVAETLGTGARPVVSLDGATVRGLAGGAAPPPRVTAADGAAPVIVAARTADRSGLAGGVDALDLSFSEPVSHPADGDGSFPLSAAGFRVTGVGAAGGTSLTLGLAESGRPDGGLRPAVSYSRGAGAAVVDGAGNEAADSSFGATTDGVAPRLVGATTRDDDLDGRIDRVAFSFSEPVSAPARGCPGCGFTLGTGLAPTGASSSSGGDVTVAVAQGAPNGGIQTTAGFDPSSGAVVTDPSGNAAPASTTFARDGAAPVLLSSRTAAVADPQRLDRVRMTFSEPMAFAGAGAQNPVQAGSGYAVDAVDAASGADLTARLHPSDAPDTGSAPAITFTDDGPPLTDANGVRIARRSYPGLTRDDVPPALVSVTTRDQDAVSGQLPGRLDAVALRYSEALAGTAPASDFTVSGHTVTGAVVGDTDITAGIDEGASPDTGDRPTVAYTPGSGSVHDVPEGPGDTSQDVPGGSGQAADGAGPVVVAAATGDEVLPDASAGHDGTIDRVTVTLSEATAFAGATRPIGVTGRIVSAVSATDSTHLVARTNQASAPDGGDKPDVTVTAASDLADPAGNPARALPFTATADGVGPTIVAARTGELASGDCGTDPVSAAGTVDCARAKWSEPVVQPTDDARFTVDPSATPDILSTLPALTTDIGLAFPAGQELRRDQSATLAYSAGTGQATDSAGNPALPTAGAGVSAAPVCSDDDDAPDALDTTVVATTGPHAEALCSRDDDWFKVVVDAQGELKLGVTPSGSLPSEVEVTDATGTPVAGGTASPNTAGQFDRVLLSNLTPGATYYVRIHDPSGKEGRYCFDPAYVDGATCDPGSGGGGSDV